jgi:hypothetical protein
MFRSYDHLMTLNLIHKDIYCNVIPNIQVLFIVAKFFLRNIKSGKFVILILLLAGAIHSNQNGNGAKLKGKNKQIKKIRIFIEKLEFYLLTVVTT